MARHTYDSASRTIYRNGFKLYRATDLSCYFLVKHAQPIRRFKTLAAAVNFSRVN
jgi:hypothetical protein